MHNGSEVKSKVVQIGTSEIKYHKFENLEGPIYSVPRSEVFIIRYENGRKEVITKVETATTTSSTTSASQSIAESDTASSINANETTVASKYAHITEAQQRTKQDVHKKKFYISPQPFIGMAIGGDDVGYSGLSVGADVLAEYFPNKKSGSGLCAGLGYNFKQYEVTILDHPINVSSLDFLLGYSFRTNDMKFFCRGMLYLSVPVSSKMVAKVETGEGAIKVKEDAREGTKTMFGVAMDAGFHFKQFNIGIRYSLSFLQQFDFDNKGGAPMIVGLFLGGSF
ncbi:MAG: outer membrane beta-barrel protein [Alistipes sp.]|nr:outer membrane beta-barrel protein [Alistipes sp.]